METAELLKAADPGPSRRGGRGPSARTVARREQLRANPGVWFLWKEESKTAGDTGQALRTLNGQKDIKGIDRKALDFEACSRVNVNGTYNIYVRYTGGGTHGVSDARVDTSVAPRLTIV